MIVNPLPLPENSDSSGSSNMPGQILPHTSVLVTFE